MKMLSAIILMFALPASASTQVGAESADAVGAWLQQRTLQAALDDSAARQQRGLAKHGVYRLVPLAELDAPETVKQQIRAQIDVISSGVLRVESGVIPSQSEVLASLPRVQRSNAILKQRLPSPPSNLGRTLLGPAELVGMEPSGVLDGLKSSGLTRFYRLHDVGIIEFNEDNFLAAGTLVEVVAEAQNTTINGAPAQLQMSVDDQGHSKAELSWATSGKAYSLVAIGAEGQNVEHNARVLQDIASAVID